MNRNIINKIKNKIFQKNYITPTIRAGNIIQVYYYRFIQNRLELIIIIGRVIHIKQRSNNLQTSTIKLKKRLYGIAFMQTIQLNSLNLIGIRVLRNK